MKIIAFSDLRTSFVLPDIDPNIVFLLGDIPSKMVFEIDQKYECPKLGVLGNHCHPLNFEDTSVINMHNRTITIDGITIAGFEGSPVYKEKPFGQHTENEANAFIRKLGSQHIDILLAHSNPTYDDMELDDVHQGFRAFNQLIHNNQVTHFFHGHLHDPFTRQVEQCTIHSVYPYCWLPDLVINK